MTGSVAAQFEDQPLGCATGCCGDGSSGCGGAGEGHQVDLRVAHESVADDAARSVNDVEHARRQYFLRQFDEPRRGQRGQFGGLDHHRVARSQRRPELPNRLPQRKVPRRDAQDDAQGFAAHVTGVVLDELPSCLTGQRAGGAGEVT